MSDNNTTIPLTEREKRLVRHLLSINLDARAYHKQLSLDKLGEIVGVSKQRLQVLQKQMKAEKGGK